MWQVGMYRSNAVLGWRLEAESEQQANIEVVAISSIVKIEILESEDERASQEMVRLI